MSNKIFIGNLSTATTEKEIFDSFSKVGKVVSVELKKSIDGITSSGHGYLIMNTEEEMFKAIKKMNNTQFGGNLIRVTRAHMLDQDKVYTYRSYKRY